MKPMPNTESIVKIDYAALQTGVAAAPEADIPWATIMWAGIALAMIAFAFGRWFSGEMEDRKKLKELLKKQEVEDAKILAEAKRIRDEGSAQGESSAARPGKSSTSASEGKAPTSAVGAAPAAHATKIAVTRSNVVTQTVADSHESDAVLSRHEVDEDFSRPIQVSTSEPISAEAMGAAVEFFRTQMQPA